MKTKYLFVFIVFFATLVANEAKACHAIALVNFSVTANATSATVNASSDSPTCGCDVYWLDVEVRCVGEAFDGAPFNPGFWGPLDSYPYFQSMWMDKDNCVVQPYPSVNIPFTGLCPGVTYQVRARENHHGEVGPWTSSQTFVVPGTIDPLACEVQASNTTICEGDCVDLDAVIIGGCGLAASYDWDLGGTVGPPPPPAECVYSICLWDTWGDGWNGGAVTVLVNGVAVLTNVTLGNGSGPICFNFNVIQGQTIQVNYTAGNWSNENYYRIFEGPNGTGNQAFGTPVGQTPPGTTNPPNNCGGGNAGPTGDPSVNVCPLVTTTYTVTITEECSGQQTTCAATIQVLPLPIAGTASISETSVCANQTVDLTLTGSDGLIQWQSAATAAGPWTNIAGGTDPSFTTDPLTSNLCFRAEVTGCGPLVYSNIVCVTINPAPTVAVADQTICAGETVTLTAVPSAGGGNFVWTPGGQTTNAISVSPGVTTTYYVEYVLNNCPGNDSAVVTVNPLPSTLNLVDGAICLGESITLTANPNITGGTFSWSPGGQTTAAIAVSPAVTTTYSVSYQVNGCDITEEVEVVVNPIPTLVLNSPSVCGSTPATVTATPNPVGGSFLWNTGQTTGSITVSPATTTSYDVEYTLNGCSVNGSTTVTISPDPVAAFTFANACSGSTIAFTNTSIGTIDSYEWDINNNGTVDYTTQNSSHTFATPGMYDVNLHVTSTDGCTHELTQTVEIFPIPAPNFQVSTVCVGIESEFINSSTIASGSIANWLWDFGDGNTSNLQNPTHSYAATGSFNVTLTTTSNNGCVNSITLNANVINTPVANFNVANQCFYNAFNFQNTSTAGIPNHSWNFGDGTTSGQINPTHTYSAAGEYTVTLIIATNSGCGDTITQTVTAYHQPNAQFSATSVCEGDASVFTDNSTVNAVFGDNVTGWSWNFGNGSTSTQQNPNHTFGSQNVYNVSLTVTTNNGCTDDITIPVTVYPIPVANFSSNVVCLGVPTVFTNSSTVSNQNSPNTINSWSWNFGDGGTSTNQNPSYTYTAAGSFNATLTVTTNNGCTDVITLPVFVSEAPNVSFTGLNLEGCSPVCFELTSTTTSSSPIADLTWNFSNGVTYSGNAVGDCFTNNSGSTISIGVELVATNAEGCSSSLFEANYINVNHNPIAYFTYNPIDPDVLYSDVDFINGSSFGDNFLWTIEGNGTSTVLNPSIEFGETPDQYLVELIAYTDEGCSDTVTSIVNIKDRIIFYVPNTFTPDDDEFNPTFTPIFTAGFDPFDYKLLIYNRWGEILFESNNTLFGWDGTYNGKRVKDGTYIWNIEFKETMSDKRHVHTGHINLLR
jgi:gliding motility-associated-like protein